MRQIPISDEIKVYFNLRKSYAELDQQIMALQKERFEMNKLLSKTRPELLKSLISDGAYIIGDEVIIRSTTYGNQPIFSFKSLKGNLVCEADK